MQAFVPATFSFKMSVFAETLINIGISKTLAIEMFLIN